jgi:tetratricopeptide (TPR) repeat protein
VEVAHEALIREWPTLRAWLEADRQGLILQQRLTDDAGEWIKMGRDPGLLYRGSRLEQVSAWAAANPEMLCLIDQEFLEASQAAAAEEERQKRQLARSKRVQRALAGFAALLLISIAYLVYTFLIYREPAVMDGFFNIAVAEFDPIGEAVARQANQAEGDIPDPDQVIYEVLQAELGGNPNLLIWRDGPELRDLNVTIGMVSGDTAEEVSRSAAETAARLGADMLIYSGKTQDQGSAVMELEFYLAPRADYDYEDLQGGFQPGCSLARDAAAFQESLAPCASTLAWIALGLTEARLGHSLEALEAFLAAGRSSPESEAIQFFLGREYLFLVDRESVLEFVREDFERQAEQAFRRSIELAPDYPRAYIGLGSVYAKRARRLISGIPGTASEPETLVAASRVVDQAVENYARALALSSSPPAGDHPTGIPIDSVARLGLGNSYLLKGRILAAQADRAGAFELFDQAIAILEQTLDPLEQAGQARYLTQAFEYLGSVYEWKAYTLLEDQDFSRGLPAYENALKYYDLCLAQGEDTEDLIIKNEIVEKICRPGRERLEEYLESLGGAQGL